VELPGVEPGSESE